MRLLVLLVFLQLFSLNWAKTLKFTQAIWRHGHRAPGELPYPNDRNDLSVWMRGWAQLTPLGMHQLKELGEFFAKRYKGQLVSDRFNVSEIYVRASDSDRAIESAQSFLQGFYPARPDEVFEKGLNWRPLPVHTSGAGQDDLLLRPTSYNCKLYDTLKSHLQFKLMVNLNRQYRDVYDYIRSNSGEKTNFNWAKAIQVAAANRELEYNLTVDPWLTKRCPNHGNRTTLNITLEWSKLSRFTEWGTDQMVKLRGGVMLNELLKTIKHVAVGQQEHPRKMALYSAHDGTVMTLLHSLKIKPTSMAPYASVVIMDVYEDDGKHYVELFYRANGQLQVLAIPGCTSLCPVDHFHNLLADNVVENKEKLDILCGNNNN